MKNPSGIPFSPVIFNSNSDMPRYRQLHAHIRDLILRGALPAGFRLPSTREMADATGVARNTVVAAYDLLVDEQFVDSVVGRGTIVRAMPALASAPQPPARDNEYAVARVEMRLPFALPDVERFPWTEWQRSVRNALKRSAPPKVRPRSIGDVHFRDLVCAYLGAYRGLRCHRDQIVITTGVQQGLDLAARVLFEFTDEAFIEEPGHIGARRAFSNWGYRLNPLPVDAQGACLDNPAIASRTSPCVIYLTPSHQFPLGPTMSLERRAAVLNRAMECTGWIVEDDYDSEFRYDGEPLTPLAGLDATSRVIYVGTFSKVLSPDMRLGYIVAPECLVERFVRAKRWSDGPSPVFMQNAMTDFIERGHFQSHLRHMRSLYRHRRDVLMQSLHESGAPVTAQLRPAGMHATLLFNDARSDNDVAFALGKHGYETPALSHHYLYPENVRHGLLVGFTCANDDVLKEFVSDLTRLMT